MYDPTSRVLTVLEMLQTRPGISGPELARRMEVDVRSVRRYITKLQDAGIPIEANPGRRGGYRLRPGYALPPLVFTPEEAKAIVLGLVGGLRPSGGVARSTVETALSKLTRVMPKETREQLRSIPAHLHSLSSRVTTPAISLILDLIDAADTHRRVELIYTAQSRARTTRIVEPYGLVDKYGRWYLVGFCRLREEYRTFRLDRIERLRTLEESFRPDVGFDYRAFAEEHLTWQPETWRVVVEFQADRQEAAKRVPAYLGPLTETETGVRLACPADDLDETARYLMLVGLPFVVLKPPELRAALRRLAQEAAQIADAEPAASGP